MDGDRSEGIDTHFSFRARTTSSGTPVVDCAVLGRTGTSPVDRPNMLSRSAAKLWAIELESD